MTPKQLGNERLLRALLHLMEQDYALVLVADQLGRCTYIASGAGLLPPAREATLTGTLLADLVHPEQQAAIATALNEARLQVSARAAAIPFAFSPDHFTQSDWSFYWEEADQCFYVLVRLKDLGAQTANQQQAVAPAEVPKNEAAMESLPGGTALRQPAAIAFETRLQMFLENTREGIYTLDPDFNFEIINAKGAEVLLKLAGVHVQPGDNLLEVVTPSRRDAIRTMYAPVFGGKTIDYETPYDTPEGSIWLSVHIDPMRDKEQNIVGLIVSTRDVTERRRAEERTQLAAEAGGIGFWELDLVRETSVRTLRHDQIFGYMEGVAHWNAQTFMTHVVPEDLPSVQAAFAEAMQTNRLFFETRITWPDGSLHWVSASGKVIRNQQNVPAIMLGTVTDITQQKTDKEALAKANERFELAAEASFDVIYDLNLEHNTVYVNDAIRTLAGYPSGEGLDVAYMRRTIYPDDKETYLAKLQSFLKSTDRHFVHEHRLVHANGNIVHVTMKAVAERKPDGKPYRVVGVLRNITEEKLSVLALREREEQYRQLFNAIPLPTWVLDHERGAFLKVNSAASDLYGYSPEAFATKTFHQLVQQQQGINLFGNGPGPDVQVHQLADGSLISVEVVDKTIRYNNQPARLVVARDISEKLQSTLR